MNKAAEFLIKGSFQLTGRGLVAVGHILNGTVKPGQKILLEINGEQFPLKISGVDIGHNIGKPTDDGAYFFVGLHIRNDNPDIKIDLKNLELKEQIAKVFE